MKNVKPDTCLEKNVNLHVIIVTAELVLGVGAGFIIIANEKKICISFQGLLSLKVYQFLVYQN
jgi:hypothetical protein